MKKLIGLLALSMLTTGTAAMAAPAASPIRPPITAVSHIGLYAADPAKSEAFYVHDLGAVKGPDPENPAGARYYFSATQFVEILPLPDGAPSKNRLDHVAYVTPKAEAMRRYLAASGVAVPDHVSEGIDHSRWFDVIDPEGHKIEFVQPPLHPQPIPPNPLSSHIIHVGFIIHNRALENGFFLKILGFKPYWYGGMTDDKASWISLQVPNGHDWLEYMVVGTPDGHGIPDEMSESVAGILDHFSLGIRNAETAYTLLWNGDRLGGQKEVPKIGRDAKWQLNLFDPDGTRAELMEFHAIGKPCCSPFTATDPLK